MLQRLSIRNIVLIDALDLDFTGGMTALTGETGAGKSILLDALGLALGERSDTGLIRASETSASVTAEFQLSDMQPFATLFDDLGLNLSATLILRRTLSKDGKSRAFLNDQPVSVTTLKSLAAGLIEIEGQFGVHALLERERHRQLLDRFGNLDNLRQSVAVAWRSWREALSQLEALQQTAEVNARESTWLRGAVDELRQLAPQTGEEEELLARRARLQQQQKLLDGLQKAWDALSGEGGAELKLSAASRDLQRLTELLPESAPAAIGAIDRAASELTEAVRLVEADQARELGDGCSLEDVEDRLYKLRAAARKFQITTAELADLAARYEAQLDQIDNSEQHLATAQAEARLAEKNYSDTAAKLSAARKKVATSFDKLVGSELAPLKLDKAVFITEIKVLDLAQAQEDGLDQVTFTVAMNPGSPLTPLHKTASGGELARLLLALKVVLADANPVDTLIFDEADTGLGGATAAAVGERLNRLAQDIQVIVITHSPQVATQAAAQLKIFKSEKKGLVSTRVIPLDINERMEEIARMLAGSSITPAARAAAQELLQAAQPKQSTRKKKIA